MPIDNTTNVTPLDSNVVYYAETLGGKDRFKVVDKGTYYHVQFTVAPHGPGDWWLDSHSGVDAARKMVQDYLRTEHRQIRVVIDTLEVG
jgi:hypothetical protein